jgi:ankyrin repeat protein
MTDVENKYRATQPDDTSRKYQSLTSYTPDNLDYLKAQAQLLQLQSQTGSGSQLSEQVEERRQRREAKKTPQDITAAVKTRPERYQRLMERRQNRSSQYGGAHSHASAEQRKAVLSAQEALLRLRAKQEEATDDSVLPSTSTTPTAAGARGRSRSVSSGSSRALLQEVAAAKESEQHLIDELEATSIDALASRAAPGLGGIDEDEDEDEADAASRQSGTAVPSMAQFVRAPPKRFQRLLEVRQEQIATAVSDGGEEDTRERGKAAADVSVEQFATLRSLEAYYKGLGGKDGSHGGSGRKTPQSTVAPAAGSNSRRGPAFAGLSTLAAHVDEVDEDGDTPLHQAAYDGQLKVVTYLVSKGANVNARNVFDETPLFVAVMNNQLEVVQYLCQQGADLSITNLEGETALDAAEGDVALWLEHYAARRRNAMLRSDEADAPPPDPEPPTAATPSPSPAPSPVPTVPAAVKAKRGKVRKTQQQMDEELLDSVQSGLNGQVGKLLEEGANPNFRDEEDETISLHHAAFNGDPKVVEALVDAGADLEARDVDECTPLHWAAEAGEVAVAKLLLLAGADVNARTGTRGTALHTALHANYHEFVAVLLDSDADVSIADEDGEQPIHAATIAGSVSAARALVDAGASVNAAGAKGGTPLHLACSRDELTVVQFLLENGADVGAVDEEGQTPLHWLCTAALVEEMTLRLMAILVDAGADINAPDRAGEAPLHVACREGQSGLVRYLLRTAGASVTLANRDGWTPLHHAASEGHLAIVRLLVEDGATIDAREGSGETPFHFACYEDHVEVAKYLYERGAAAWRMVQWAETAITSSAATWINRIAPAVRDARRREIEAAERRKAEEEAASAADRERARAATAAAKAAFEESFGEGEAGPGSATPTVNAGAPVTGDSLSSVSDATTKLASRLNWKAAKLELDEMSRADRNRLIAMCTAGAVVVAIVWRYSAPLAILLALVIGGAIFAKRFLESI